MRVESVDPEDDRAFEEWSRSLNRCKLDAFPDDPGWTDEELDVFVRHPTDADVELALARDGDGVAIGSVGLFLPARENLDLVAVHLAVDPSHRQRGAGRALLEHAERSIRAHGRSTISSRSDEKAEAGASREERFATAAGYRVARVDARRDLRLPVPPVRISDLRSAGAEHAAGYAMVTWQGACPDDYANGRADLSRVMSLDAPHGELLLDEATWDVARLRTWESDVAAAGRVLLGAGAVDVATGELVGFTELAISSSSGAVAFQFDTVVSPQHRGHRLGLLIKLANLEAVQEGHPGTSRVVTNNAQENEFMISTNCALGFEFVARTISWLKTLT